MKDRYTIIKEEFDTITGITTVIINTDIGTFEGETKMDDIDVQYPSIYHANEIAIAKALRKYAKAMLIITREKMQPLQAILHQCVWIDDNSDNLIWGKATYLIRKEIVKLEKEKKLWEKRIEVMSKNITQRIAARDKIVKEYIEKENNKDKKD